MSKVKIPFSQPVKTYTAVELAKMPLIEMKAAIDAQEKHFFIEAKMGGDATDLKRELEAGRTLYAVFERGHTRYVTRINGEDIYWPPRIVRQLEKRDFLEMVKLTKDGEV